MASDFRLQIIDRHTGEVVQSWEPGSYVETELIENLGARLVGLGVGIGRTNAHVLADLRAAWAGLVLDLKTHVVPK